MLCGGGGWVSSDRVVMDAERTSIMNSVNDGGR